MAVSNDSIIFLHKPLRLVDGEFSIFRAYPVQDQMSEFLLIGYSPGSDHSVIVNKSNISIILREEVAGKTALLAASIIAAQVPGFLSLEDPGAYGVKYIITKKKPVFWTGF